MGLTGDFFIKKLLTNIFVLAEKQYIQTIVCFSNSFLIVCSAEQLSSYPKQIFDQTQKYTKVTLNSF